MKQEYIEFKESQQQKKGEEFIHQLQLLSFFQVLNQLEEEKKKGTVHSYVKDVGQGERAEKIKTYNFPQNRLTDHVRGKSFHNLEDVINQGRWEKILNK